MRSKERPAVAKITRAAFAATILSGWGSSAYAQLQVIDPATLAFEAGRLGVPSATIGSPDRGGLYMFFVRYRRGMRSPLHTHSDDRMLTVLQGTLYVGEAQDGRAPISVRPVKAGASLLITAGVPHFGWAKDGVVLTQEIGMGPTSTTMVTKAR